MVKKEHSEQASSPALEILRRRQVEARVGLSRSTLYSYIKDGRFPAPIRLGNRAVGWLEAEVLDWLRQRIEATREAGR